MYLRYFLVYSRGLPGLVTASARPELTAASAGGEESWVGDRPFPHWLAADLVRHLREKLAEAPARDNQRGLLRRAIDRRLARWGRPTGFAWERLQPSAFSLRSCSEELLEMMRGRILLASEAETILDGRAGDPGAALAELAAAGRIAAMPAVEILHFGRAICRRCGETEVEQGDCWLCGDRHCWICPTCREMGAATGCRTLYALPGGSDRVPPIRIHPRLTFGLTAAQQRAVEALQSFITGRGGDFMLWAVCGAGKTEVMLYGLAEALGHGARILVATPRRDVAAELGARIRSAFPGLDLAVHYGGCHEEDAADPAVTIATTHQCLRFFHRFDLTILDEVDAFPYHNNKMLYAAVERARKPDGALVYLTATPPDRLIRRGKEGDLPYIRLPVRPHGRPLPVPRLVRLDLDQPGPHWRVPGPFEEILAARTRPVLVFAPTVHACEQVGRALARWGEGRGERVAWVYAGDEERAKKRRDFANGLLDILVTTTVLERGLNLGSLDVYVLYADREDLFDRSSLVQIAGRAGRTAADPRGEVIFFGARISRAMREAREAIEAANAEAAALGYLEEQPKSLCD